MHRIKTGLFVAAKPLGGSQNKMENAAETSNQFWTEFNLKVEQIRFQLISELSCESISTIRSDISDLQTCKSI